MNCRSSSRSRTTITLAEPHYDGQFYAQMAMVPLLTTPAIDRAIDNPPYRARRILTSWTAHLAGLGDPPHVLRAYAAQNLVVVILLAVLLSRRLIGEVISGVAV